MLPRLFLKHKLFLILVIVTTLLLSFSIHHYFDMLKMYGSASSFGKNYLITVIALTMAIIVAVLLLARISWKDVRRIVHGLKEMSEGNLSYRIEIKSRDELFAISTSINKMVENLAKSEKALRERAEFLDNVLGSIGEGLIVIDKDYKIISANRAYMEHVKSGPNHIIGRHCYEVSHGLDTFCHEKGSECAVKAMFEAGRPCSVTHIHVDKHGEPLYHEIKAFPLREADGRVTAVVEVIDDITEKKRLEEQLHHAQKMEAIGQLAGGMAHDFNNILTAIVGYANLLSMKLDSAEMKHYVDQILASTDRASRLTQGLLAYSRKQIVQPKPIDLNEVVGRMERFLGRLIGEDIELKTMTSKERMIVIADSVQVEQILMNLATNARDAMPDGGTLFIETQTVYLDMDFIKRHNYGKVGNYALLSVSDTGVGMDQETAKRIFEPFFTTKEAGKGTGLGLAIVYGIVKQHGGYINVYSEHGKGTTFKIYLPIADVELNKDRQSRAEWLSGGRETILVAEDDEAVRSLMRTVLAEFGYKVIEAVDGAEAVEKFKEHADAISLLILDIIMPKMNGKAAYDEIVKIKPGTRAIFTSGYTANIIHKKGIIEKGIVFLSKPVSPTELLRKIREVLAG